ncbi:hypothetical protein [Natronococcus wangiae]|uniref:hypothetical protein n=1 Tax=Natronococcus wangiae TaxID=3068275 RepID=UPI00273D2871|nr:hypothetical protein [Natronococcus sp. AD5]
MPTSSTTRRSLALSRVETIDAAATVRHVDQLDEETLDAFYRALEGTRSVGATEIGLEPGTIVVATDYYRVEST